MKGGFVAGLALADTDIASRKEFPYTVLMIQSRITTKAQTTVPRAVRAALGLELGDELVWEIEDGRAIVSRANDVSDPFVNNFSTFTEWASEADCEAFDNL